MTMDKFYIIDKTGKIIAEPKITSVGTLISCFKEGVAPVEGETGWGYIDTTGTFVIKPIFQNAKQFSNGLAVVRLYYRDGYINKKGEFVIDPQFSLAYDFEDDIALIMCMENNEYRYGYINKKGEFIIKPKFEEARIFINGVARVKEVGKEWESIDKRGNYISNKIEHDSCNKDRVTTQQKCLNEDLSPSKKDGKYGYIDRYGNVIIEHRFEHAYPFHEGLALVEIDKKYGYINKIGAFVIEPKFDYGCYFSEGLAIVVIKGDSSYSSIK